MTDNVPEKSATSSQILLYQTEDGRSRIEVRLEDETVWLSQDLMAELFQTTKQNISLHIHNIFKEGELDQHSVVKEYLTTASDGKKYKTRFYNLDVIIAVGYRVRSHRGTQFRQWATERLREYIVKGFTLDDDRLKQADGRNYFDELQALNRNPMTMHDWITKLDDFLRLSGREILTHAGQVSHDKALDTARAEYEKYRKARLMDASPVERHFLKSVEELKQIEGKGQTGKDREE